MTVCIEMWRRNGVRGREAKNLIVTFGCDDGRSIGLRVVNKRYGYVEVPVRELVGEG